MSFSPIVFPLGCNHRVTLGQYGQYGGLLNSSNPVNPYKDYTLVWALYCSGDLFAGNVTSTFITSFPSFENHERRGYYNVQSILEWLHRQQSMGSIASTLSKFIVSGDSAGSAGAVFWADQLLTQFPSSTASVVIDCAPIVAPGIVYSMVFSNWGVCSTPLLPPSLQSACYASQPFGLKDIAFASMAKHPSVPYVFLISKYDAFLIGYYELYAGVYFGFPQISVQEYYQELVLDIDYLNQQPNFITFLVDSTQHTYTQSDITLAYTTTYGVGAPSGSSLLSLLAALPLSNGQSISTQCDNCAGLGFYPKKYTQEPPPAPAPTKSKPGPKTSPEAAVESEPALRRLS